MRGESRIGAIGTPQDLSPSLSIGPVGANADRHVLDLAPVVTGIRARGATSLPVIARELNDRGVLTRRRGRWHVSTVMNLLDRPGLREPACASLG